MCEREIMGPNALYELMQPNGDNIPRSEQRGMRTLAFVCVLVCCMLSASCFPRWEHWDYRANSYPPTTQPALHKTVVVVSFKDSRPNENTTMFFRYPMTLIPLIPYGWAGYARPEDPATWKLRNAVVEEAYGPYFSPMSIPWQFRPERDFPAAASHELHVSGFFKDVVFSDQVADRDLVLRGELLSTRYLAKSYLYGLGPLHFALWMVGAPIGHVSNELAIEFVLEERVTGASLWRKSYHETEEATFYLYWMPSEFYYGKLFNRIMRDVVKSLQAELPARTLGATDGSPASSRSSFPN
jgi:hypothetical protein